MPRPSKLGENPLRTLSSPWLMPIALWQMFGKKLSTQTTKLYMTYAPPTYPIASCVCRKLKRVEVAVEVAVVAVEVAVVAVEVAVVAVVVA